MDVEQKFSWAKENLTARIMEACGENGSPQNSACAAPTGRGRRKHVIREFNFRKSISPLLGRSLGAVRNHRNDF